VPAARALPGHRDRVLREVDAVGLEAALLRQVEEAPGAAAEVQQTPPATVVEQRREGVEDELVAPSALGAVVPGEEVRVVLLVQPAEALGPDPRVAVEQAAARAADHVVAALAPLWSMGDEQRLDAPHAAQVAADRVLDLA